jgi:hypothetical protein
MGSPKVFFTTLVLSCLPLLSAATSSDISPRSNPSKGKIVFNKRGNCNAPYDKTAFYEVDTCIPIINSGYQLVKVVDAWPTCSDGSDARFATFGFQNGNCDADGDMNPLEDKQDYLNTCAFMGLTGSFAFWCDGAVYKEPEWDGKDHTSTGGVLQWNEKKCNRNTKPKPKYYKPDTCIDVKEGLGLALTGTATCKNGTNALVAGFAGKGCDPTSKPLSDPFTKWDDRMAGFCLPTDGINSMTFWCDGFDDIDINKPKPAKKSKSTNLGLIVGLSVGIGGTLLILMGLAVAYSINYHFRERVKVYYHSPSLHQSIANCSIRRSSEGRTDILHYRS